jgi:hypothetical protein
MKKNKGGLWMLALIASLVLLFGTMTACAPDSSNDTETGEDFTQPVPQETVEVTISIPVPGSLTKTEVPEGEINMQSVIPGSVPFQLFGSLIGQINFGNRLRYDPRADAVTYPVSGGQFTDTFTIPVGQTYHLGAITNGKLFAHNITIGSTLMQHACIIGSGDYYSYGVVSFIVNRDQNGQVTVTENPNCTHTPVISRLVRNGDSQLALYDDNPFLPYNGTAEGPMTIQSSVATWASPQTMATFVAGTGWVEDFYTYTSTASDLQIWAGWFSVYQDAVRRNVVPPVNPLEPGLGGLYLRTYAANGTTPLCVAPANTELTYWIDWDATANNFYGAEVERIDSVTNCPVVLGDNRMSIQ